MPNVYIPIENYIDNMTNAYQAGYVQGFLDGEGGAALSTVGNAANDFRRGMTEKMMPKNTRDGE